MKATKVANIQQTRNYDSFKADAANRAVSKINRIRDSMQRYGWLDAYPMHVVAVNGHFVIKDGQHRFESAKALDIPVKFVVCDDVENLTIADINNAQRKWTVRDYAGCWKQQGNPDYARLLQFSDVSGLPLGICAALLSNNLPESLTNLSSSIRNGKFRIKTIDFANEVASVVNACLPIVAWARNARFVGAVARILRVKDVTAFALIEKIQANPGMLRHMPTIDEFMKLLEDIYNHRSRQRMPIKFLAEEECRKRNACSKHVQA